MEQLPLHCRDGHLFLEVAGNLWLFDTGAPSSFGRIESVNLAGERARLADNYLGLTSDVLSRFVAVECAGLLGADVLGRFDFLLDSANSLATISTGELQHTGPNVELDEFMGIPIVTVEIGARDYRMFLDSGAQLSFLQDDSLARFPSAGEFTDFYPGFGQFETETHNVPVSLGGEEFIIRCGTLPGLLGMTLMMAGVSGIIGTGVLVNRVVGYFPRRQLLVL